MKGEPDAHRLYIESANLRKTLMRKIIDLPEKGKKHTF